LRTAEVSKKSDCVGREQLSSGRGRSREVQEVANGARRGGASGTDLAVELLESPLIQTGEAVNDAPLRARRRAAVAEGDH
jgi:hypothetical protein